MKINKHWKYDTCLVMNYHDSKSKVIQKASIKYTGPKSLSHYLHDIGEVLLSDANMVTRWNSVLDLDSQFSDWFSPDEGDKAVAGIVINIYPDPEDGPQAHFFDVWYGPFISPSVIDEEMPHLKFKPFSDLEI